jgi:hypothetical protein
MVHVASAGGGVEDCNHIFFECDLVRFMWARAVEFPHCDWNPVGAWDFMALAQGMYVPYLDWSGLPSRHVLIVAELDRIFRGCKIRVFGGAKPPKNSSKLLKNRIPS